MKRSRIPYRGLSVIMMAVWAIVGFVGCDMFVGPHGGRGETGPAGGKGEPGEQGPPGEALYLVDDLGVRIWSGGSFFLGEAVEYGPEVVTTFRLVNELGVGLELVSITEVTSYLTRWTGSIENVDGVDEISVAYTGEQTIVDGALSDPIVVTFEFFEWNGIDGIARKRYRIELTDGDTIYYFDVELYGVLSFSSGS